jgi:hypothetical protein
MGRRGLRSQRWLRMGHVTGRRKTDARLWAEYEHLELPCFLCDAPAQKNPLFAQILPDPKHDDKLLGAPLCSVHAALPPMLRLHRCLKLLKRIMSQPGKPLTIQFGPQRQPHPR